MRIDLKVVIHFDAVYSSQELRNHIDVREIDAHDSNHNSTGQYRIASRLTTIGIVDTSWLSRSSPPSLDQRSNDLSLEYQNENKKKHCNTWCKTACPKSYDRSRSTVIVIEIALQRCDKRYRHESHKISYRASDQAAGIARLTFNCK